MTVFDRYSHFLELGDGFLERKYYSKWRSDFLRSLKRNILEIGIGTGKNLQYYRKNCSLTAIDVSKGMLEKAKKNAEKLGKKAKFFQMPAEELQFKDNSFDHVVSFLVLCSVSDQLKSLREMKRVCRKNGSIILVEHVDAKGIFGKILLRMLKPFLISFAGCSPTRKTAC